MSKDNKHNLILLIGALCLCTLVLCGFVLVPIIASEFAEQAPEQQETRKTIERVLDKNLSRTPLPSNFTITFRKTNGLWLSNVDATDKDMALLAQNEDVEKLKVVSAMTGKGLESLEKEPIWDLEVRKHYFDRASFEAISRMKNLKRLVINRGEGIEENCQYLTGPAKLYHLELNIVKIDDRCLEHLLSVYSSTQEFELSFNKEKLSAGFAALAKLPKIKSIIFTDDKLSGAPIKEICKIDRTLQLASFRHCGITDDDALSIRNLSIAKLNLADNPITDKGLLNLRGVKGLKELNIEDCNKITENGEAEFARTKPAVRIVKKAPEKVPSREDKLLKEFFAS